MLRLLDPEDAHRLALRGLRMLPYARPRPDDSKLAVRAFGLNFPNPVGIAAGFDKNAEVPDALLRLGFGFAEIGSVTPKPQSGNPRPRIFRLERDEAIINRLGFNNEGAEVVLRRLAARAQHGGIVGVNVGANKDSVDRIDDYVRLIETFAPVASYFTVNVSSPNTPGLRNLQQAAALDDLLAKVIDARDRVQKSAGDSPVLLKIAPDLSLADLDDVVHNAAPTLEGWRLVNLRVTYGDVFRAADGKTVQGVIRLRAVTEAGADRAGDLRGHRRHAPAEVGCVAGQAWSGQVADTVGLAPGFRLQGVFGDSGGPPVVVRPGPEEALVRRPDQLDLRDNPRLASPGHVIGRRRCGGKSLRTRVSAYLIGPGDASVNR
eukprot:gene1408-1882_t